MNPHPTPEDYWPPSLRHTPRPRPPRSKPSVPSTRTTPLNAPSARAARTDPTATLFHPKITPVPATSGPWSITPGQVLGDFTLIQRLGRGGMGEVWRRSKKVSGARSP